MNVNGVPSEEECLAILRKYSTPSIVVEHCIFVKKTAEEICQNMTSIDIELIVAGALLHDIGRAVTHSIRHGVEGAKILQEEGISAKIISIVKNHIGTGIDRIEAEKLGLPPDDYIPKASEEIIVSYADNLVCDNHKRSFNETLKHFIHKFGEESTVVHRLYKQKEFIKKLSRTKITK